MASTWAALLRPTIVTLNQAAASEQGWGRGLTDEELINLLYMSFQALGYFLYLFLFLMWYTRMELLVPRFVQVCVRMTSCIVITALFLHDGPWVLWYNQVSLGRMILDEIRRGEEQP